MLVSWRDIYWCGIITGVDTCIYCNTNPANSDEHHLPYALGKFKGYKELKNRVCKSCNSKIGEAEGPFLRTSEIGLLRNFFSLSGRKRKKNENPFYGPSYGTPPIDITGVDPWDGKEKKWEIKDGGITQLEALYVTKKDGTKETVPLNPNIKSLEDMKSLLEIHHLSEANVEEIEIEVSQERSELIEEQLIKVFKSGKFEWREDRESTPRQIPVQARVYRKAVDYYRVIAKIGFHYLLTHCNFFSGNEKEFDGIKSFIFSGNETDTIERFVVEKQEPILYEMQQGKLPEFVGHLIIADLQPDRIFIYIHLFISSQLHDAPSTIPYTVMVGNNPQRVLCDYSVGNYFYLYKEGMRDGYHGEIINTTSLYSK